MPKIPNYETAHDEWVFIYAWRHELTGQIIAVNHSWNELGTQIVDGEYQIEFWDREQRDYRWPVPSITGKDSARREAVRLARENADGRLLHSEYIRPLWKKVYDDPLELSIQNGLIKIPADLETKMAYVE